MKSLELLIFVAFASILSSCTDVLPVKEKELAVVNVPNQSYKLRIVHMPSNATIQSSIQVRKSYNNNKEGEEVLQDYERYNSLEGYKLIDDTALMIVIKDTISYLRKKHLDTMIVKFE